MTNLKKLYTRLNDYLRQYLSRDLKASLSVAMIAIPQAMAYAAIAGVNPVHGLYAAIISPVVASFIGSSDRVVTGSTNTNGVVKSAVLIPFLGQKNYPEYVFALVGLSGLDRLALGLLNLDYIIRYAINAVVTAFLTGAALLIILNQTVTLLEIPLPCPAAWPGAGMVD